MLKSRQRTQVAIIGAGPSGSVAAALLNQNNIDVVVLEKNTFPRFSIGESLLPACMEVIKKANMLDAVIGADFQYKNGAAFRRRDTYTAFDFRDKFTAGAGTTYQVQRGNFDKVLADEAAKQGVQIRYQHSVEAIECGDTRSVITVRDELSAQTYALEADFILDASGFGRVLPRLLDLEQPSCLPVRHAIFTHVVDHIEDSGVEHDREKILISVHPTNEDVWFWLIPFSNGTCSLGVVAEPEFLAQYDADEKTALQQIVAQEPTLNKLLSKAEYTNPAAQIGGYSANVKHLATKRYALLGNAGEFLDPIFSSGVTIAMQSADLVVSALLKQLAGDDVNWQQEYADKLMVGVNTFRTYVEGWYSGELQKVIFYTDPEPKIKQMVCSILAGYAWDHNNPFVAQSERRLRTLAEICS